MPTNGIANHLVSCAIAVLLCSSTAMAQETVLQSADGSISLSGGLGLGYVRATEFVYLGSFKGSQLDFRSDAVTIYSADLTVDLPQEWNLRFGADIGDGGDGVMTDYDWIAPYYTDTSKNGWSDRSRHPDTRLDHYWSASAELGRDIYAFENTRIGALVGFKYTDVKWDAYGGSYIYSTAGVRDDKGNFPSGEIGISYRQKVPVAYLGLNGSQALGKLSFAAGVNGGLSLGIQDTDNHWARNLLFNEDIQSAPMVMATVGASYELTPKTSVYLSGSFERVYRARGDSHVEDTATGKSETNRDVAGALFQSALIKFGIKGSF